MTTIRKPFDGPFRVVSPFGWRTDPITGAAHVWHGGVDLVSEDRAVRAVPCAYAKETPLIGAVRLSFKCAKISTPGINLFSKLTSLFLLSCPVTFFEGCC